MIDVEVRGETYVIEYVVGKGYGLSKQSGAVFGWEGVDEAFGTLAELELGVRKLMATPGCGQPPRNTCSQGYWFPRRTYCAACRAPLGRDAG